MLSPTEDRDDDNYMVYSEFKHCLFELADIWVETIDGARYATFLEEILEKLPKNYTKKGARRSIYNKPKRMSMSHVVQDLLCKCENG